MHSSRTRAAFTLIELLTVIAIIAILMGLLFPAMNSVKESARKTQAKNDETQIVTAIKAFFTEYGKYPVPTATTADYSSPAASNSDVINTLRSVATGINAANVMNPRQIVFMEVPSVKDTANPKGGVDANGVFWDPWGKKSATKGGVYQIRIDGGYKNSVANPYGANKGAGSDPLLTGAIVWSFGKDGVQASNLTGSDDVVSWQ